MAVVHPGGVVVLTLVTAVGLVSWFGYERVVTRLGTIQDEYYFVN